MSEEVMETKKTNKAPKVLKIILDVILYVFLAICIFVVIITISAKRSPDGAARIFGYEMRIVVSDSMAESKYTDVSDYEIGSIPIESAVFIETVPEDKAEATEWYRSLKKGDVLTFRYVYGTQRTITHRITYIKEKPTGGFEIMLTGDNKSSEEGQLSQLIDTSIPNNTNYVLGKVVGTSEFLGVVLTFLKSPAGIIFAIIVPCLAIVLFEVTKIVRTLTEDKRLRVKEEQQKKESELEELRRKLAELEAQKGEPDDNSMDEEEKQ